jgi:hypothetical protein
MMLLPGGMTCDHTTTAITLNEIRLYDACLEKLQGCDEWKEGLEELGHELAVEEQLAHGNILSRQELTSTLVQVGKESIPKEAQEAIRSLVQASTKKVREEDER